MITFKNYLVPYKTIILIKSVGIIIDLYSISLVIKTVLFLLFLLQNGGI